MSDTLHSFLLILAASFAFSLLISHIPLLRIPSAIGYLLFGILLHSGVVVLSADEFHWLNLLGDFGLLFLMFLSGLEVEVAALRPHTWKEFEQSPLGLAAAMFSATLLLSFASSVVIAHFGAPGSHPWMLALLLSTTSLGIILPILDETGVLQTQYGQALLLSALVADFLTMLFVSLFVSLRTSGQAIDFLLALALIPAVVLCYWLLQAVRRAPSMRRWAGDAQTRLRAVVALCAAACAFADFTGAEPILGSFLTGMLVASLPFAYKDRLRLYCHGLGYGLFIPIFFISVGLHFHFALFHRAGVWTELPLLFGAALAVKLLPALGLFQSFGWRRASAGGILLSSRLSLVAAAALIGVHLGVMTPLLAQSLILVAVVTCLVCPVLFVTLLRH